MKAQRNYDYDLLCAKAVGEWLQWDGAAARETQWTSKRHRA